MFKEFSKFRKMSYVKTVKIGTSILSKTRYSLFYKTTSHRDLQEFVAWIKYSRKLSTPDKMNVLAYAIYELIINNNIKLQNITHANAIKIFNDLIKFFRSKVNYKQHLNATNNRREVNTLFYVSGAVADNATVLLNRINGGLPYECRENIRAYPTIINNAEICNYKSTGFVNNDLRALDIIEDESIPFSDWMYEKWLAYVVQRATSPDPKLLSGM